MTKRKSGSVMPKDDDPGEGAKFFLRSIKSGGTGGQRNAGSDPRLTPTAEHTARQKGGRKSRGGGRDSKGQGSKEKGPSHSETEQQKTQEPTRPSSFFRTQQFFNLSASDGHNDSVSEDTFLRLGSVRREAQGIDRETDSSQEPNVSQPDTALKQHQHHHQFFKGPNASPSNPSDLLRDPCSTDLASTDYNPTAASLTYSVDPERHLAINKASEASEKDLGGSLLDNVNKASENASFRLRTFEGNDPTQSHHQTADEQRIEGKGCKHFAAHDSLEDNGQSTPDQRLNVILEDVEISLFSDIENLRRDASSQLQVLSEGLKQLLDRQLNALANIQRHNALLLGKADRCLKLASRFHQEAHQTF